PLPPKSPPAMSRCFTSGVAAHGVPVPENGILVDVDLSALIERIVLGSTTTEAERATVAQHVASAGLSDRLELSTLLGQPRYV
ncbi:hypothetical protein, partial [Salipiger profundus]|uniref:hypothetical protein n=2 Tax=Salipiger TaxID=263377 RepID=UPI001E31D158